MIKKGFIILIIFILVCIAGGSFLAIHLIRNIEVNETSIVKEPLNHEGIENFTSVNLDLTSMDVKIEKSSENAISYRLQDVKKQKLDYSVDDGVLTVKEIILDKHFVGHDDNEVIIYTTNDSLLVNGNLVAGDVEIQNVALKDSRVTSVSALRQLDEQAAAAMTQRMRVAMTKPERLFPIRISCYYSGALMVNALAASGAYSFNQAGRPIACSMLKTVCPSDGDFPERESCCRRVSDAITSFEETSEHIIQSALEKNNVVLNGPLELLCVNIYDARFYKGYMTSRFFLMYRDESGEKMIPGNFVIEMADERTISKVYKAPTM